MTPPLSPRHLLVVAPQCPDLGPLDGLEELAGSLHAALADAAVGGCEQAAPGDSSLLCGPQVGQAQVEKAVRAAAERAGEAEAGLVLAFLGHGTTPGDVPRLAFMASDSRADAPTTVVDLGGLLSDALDTPGVQGVVALVDTCRAGGAVPDLAALGAGVRRGATMLSLLTSVGVTEDAYGLSFTRGLLRVLREGVSGAGEFLSAQEVRDAVNAVTGTGAQALVQEGDLFGQRPWIARNARHAAHGGTLLGPLGAEELRWALEPLGEAVPPSPPDAAEDLTRLRETLSELSRDGTADACDVTSALHVVGGLSDALRTTALLRRWPGAPLTSPRLRRAFSAAAGSTVRAPLTDGGELLRDCVESLRLRVAGVRGNRRAPLAAFVAALAAEDQLSSATPELAAWADAVDAVLELNDAFAELARASAEGRLRLVVSLHAAVADDWPETLLAWLLDGGTSLAHDEFPCPATQAGVEQTLGTVLTWAAKQARQAGLRLRHVDIAAPSALLAGWRPEEARVGPRLGLRYNVVLRWSDRLCPPAHISWINDYARDRLEAMEKGDRVPLDWLGQEETGRADDLADRLESGLYERALALAHRPDRLADFLPPLLAYAPIVLWPQGPGELPAASRDSVERLWDRLPAELSAAYRSAWKEAAGGQDPAGGHADLARVRSAWLDTQWLDFCDWFDTRTGDGENTR
ncbi:hypothetical protein [Streptomyces sp. 3214.6]|uniref:vWA-MoxR associated conflict system protein n=1 Tax=Streptomyces sp. 3214.6 TaxID=1882757 RepID=UPI00090A0ADB|nr:hypothetical protein [Streptomyces sp. 3214.6]SHI52283.1 hypothetical protein SAMN05444521_7781 [Streptomyces sp. 3214.6]